MRDDDDDDDATTTKGAVPDARDADARARDDANDVDAVIGIAVDDADDGFLQPARAVRGDAVTTRAHGSAVVFASPNTRAGAPIPRTMPRVEARTHETPPAVGTPVADATGARTTMVRSPGGGVFEFSTLVWGSGEEFTRERLEREIAMELGTPSGALPVDLETLAYARQLSRVTRLFALVDVVFCVLYSLLGYRAIIALVIGPLCGYVGSKTYNPSLVAAYLAFCVVGIAWRVANLFMFPDVTARVLPLISIVISSYIARLVARFFYVLRLVPPNGRELLRQLDMMRLVATAA